MRHASFALVALLLAAVGCADGRSVLVVKVSSTGAVLKVDRFNVLVSNGGQKATVDVPLPGRPVDFPANHSFSLGFAPSRKGAVDVEVEALDGTGRSLAKGAKSGELKPGQASEVQIVLLGRAMGDLGPGGDLGDLGPATEGGVGDMGSPQDLPEGADLPPSPDLAAAPDLVDAPDLADPPDLAQ